MTRLDDDSTVLVASAWHADCDPFVTVVVARKGPYDGTVHQTIERMMSDIITAEVRDVLTSDCDESCEIECEEHAPDIRESGAFEERLGSLDLDWDVRMDLQRNGYTYI